MNCEEAAPRLALAALRIGGEAGEAQALASHLAVCARCRERRLELERARGALDAVAVAPPPQLEIERGPAAAHPPAAAPRRRAAGFLPLAAALVAGASSGWLAAHARAPEPSIATPAVASPASFAPTLDSLATALLLVEERLGALEERHARDLVALARSIDAEQARRDRDVAAELATFVRATDLEFARARQAVERLALHFAAAPGPRERD